MAVKRLSLLALFIALSVIGASIKIPAFIGSVALDAFPALVAAVLVSRRAGALVAGFGHIVSALAGGMPLGLLHIVIAAEMAVIVWLFGFLYEKGGSWLAGVCFVIGNGLLAPLPMMFLFGTSFYIALLLPLFVGSVLNMLIAVVFIPRLAVVFRNMLSTSY